MREVRVRLSKETEKRLVQLAEKYGLKDLEEALRFLAHFTLLVVERVEKRRMKVLPRSRKEKSLGE
ncbi:MAG: hypothetical protein FGF50_10480 [Candidatus Brockarchaeota archaeon]|nr:hypothetical protein [Candidatus Brockarchaeota archaeon]